MTWRSDSGSSCSPITVELVRSVKRTVRILRTSVESRGGGRGTAVQAGQVRSASRRAEPHSEHADRSLTGPTLPRPQVWQRLAPQALSARTRPPEGELGFLPSV